VSKESRSWVLLATLGFSLLVIACYPMRTLEPQEAVNPVGSQHTVTFTWLWCDPESPECIPPDTDVYFEVVAGPNAGLHSDADCGASGDDPCVIPAGEDSVSWTYTGTGGAGTDEIRACPILEAAEMQALIESISAQTGMTPQEVMVVIQAQGGASTQAEIVPVCGPTSGFRAAMKTWVAPPTPTPEPTPTETAVIRDRPPNIGAGLSGLFQGQPTPLPTAPVPAGVAPSSASIRPPSTGDAGLSN